MSICPVQTITLQNSEHKTPCWCAGRHASAE